MDSNERGLEAWLAQLGVTREDLWELYKHWWLTTRRRHNTNLPAEAELEQRLHVGRGNAARYRDKLPAGMFLLALCHRSEKAQVLRNPKDLDNHLLDESFKALFDRGRSQLAREMETLKSELTTQAQRHGQEQDEAAQTNAALQAQVQAAQSATQQWRDKVQELETTLAAIPDWGLARNHLFILDQALRPKGLVAPEGWESPALLRRIAAWKLAEQDGNTAAAKQVLQDVQRQTRQERVVYLWTWPIRKLLEIVLAEHDDDQGPPK